jgi:hypothetical protein
MQSLSRVKEAQADYDALHLTQPLKARIYKKRDGPLVVIDAIPRDPREVKALQHFIQSKDSVSFSHTEYKSPQFVLETTSIKDTISKNLQQEIFKSPKKNPFVDPFEEGFFFFLSSVR